MCVWMGEWDMLHFESLGRVEKCYKNQPIYFIYLLETFFFLMDKNHPPVPRKKEHKLNKPRKMKFSSAEMSRFHTWTAGESFMGIFHSGLFWHAAHSRK